MNVQPRDLLLLLLFTANPLCRDGSTGVQGNRSLACPIQRLAQSRVLLLKKQASKTGTWEVYA